MVLWRDTLALCMDLSLNWQRQLWHPHNMLIVPHCLKWRLKLCAPFQSTTLFMWLSVYAVFPFHFILIRLQFTCLILDFFFTTLLLFILSAGTFCHFCFYEENLFIHNPSNFVQYLIFSKHGLRSSRLQLKWFRKAYKILWHLCI